MLHLVRTKERWPFRLTVGVDDNPSLVRRDLYVTNLRAGAARSSLFRGIASVAYGLPPMYSTEDLPARLIPARSLSYAHFAPNLEIKMSSKQTPAFRIYQVCPRGQDKAHYWREIGVGFLNQDSSVNLKFEAIPVDFNQTTVQLRPVEENRRTDEPTAQS